jgi:hypothetical protein
MQEGQNARQQVVERIRQSTSILVAVGNNPSVDALAASLGLSLMLNKMNKHATAVFSGQIPEVIQFLEPSKTFETNVDALRDFIISLDKEKADRLRYKVEDDVVRIFITPYKTSITDKDLQFSQGDFNVDLIIALGVEKREDLDKAIVAHGRILHDATVITINADNQRSTLGAIDYNDAAASSLCEMLVSMSEAFQQPGILDAQISTALLTGIVANTDRFSNPRTSPRVMTMAAQLMAAGANQQLIATNLEKAQEITKPAQAGPMAKQQASAVPAPMQEEPPKPKKEPGELDIVHEKPADTPKTEAVKSAPALIPAAPITPPTEPEITAQQEKELEEALPTPQVQHNLLPEVKEELAGAVEAEEEKPAGEPSEGPKAPGSESVNDPTAPAKKEDGEGDYISSHGSWKGKRLEPPTLGGTLNATTEEAHDAAVKAEEADRNQKLLTHPNDAPQKSKRSRNRRGKGGNNNDVPAVAAAPVVAAAATPALPAEPAPAPLPPAPEPVIEQPPVAPEIPSMPAQPEAAPVAPEPPVLAPEPTPAPLPPLPAMPELPAEPAPLPEPVLPPVPVALPEPAPAEIPAPMPPLPAAAPTDDLEALHKEVADSAAEAAAVAQPAENTAGELDTARAAVSQAFDAQPFNPAGQPLASVGSQPLPGAPAEPGVPFAPAPLQESAFAPMPDPLQTLPPAPVADAAPVSAPAPVMDTAPAPVPPAFPGLPPLPPMPPVPDGSAELPPAPDLPGLNAPLPPINSEAPAADSGTPPPAPSSDPRQYQIPGA